MGATQTAHREEAGRDSQIAVRPSRATPMMGA